MVNAIMAGLAPGHRSLTVVETPYPQRQDRVQDKTEEGMPSGGGGDGSSIDTREVPIPQHQPWSDFTADKLLPDSVYLWACDEPQTGGSRPSRTDACVAWIILITQMICYIQLIVVSSTELSDNSSTSSSADEVTSTAKEGSYSLVSVAAAMYLMMSIAAADLGAGIALISEARVGMAAKRWVQRKMFGFMLLTSFILLAAASLMMLFKTSSEDVELVVGAATVLFIADVDEKVVVVLKVIPSKWRLFWVLELIGLSAALALLGLRVTDSGSNVSENGHGDCIHGNADGVEWGCFIYDWYFILNYHPVSVTAISLLVNAFVASPKEFIKKHVLGSRQDWLFPVTLAFWILSSLVIYSIKWGFAVRLSIVSVYAICLGCEWLPIYKRFLCCQDPDESNAICLNFRGTSSTRFGVICVPAGVIVVGIVLGSLAIKLDVVWSEFDTLDPSRDLYVVPEALYSLLFNMWLLWCMCRGGNNSPERASSPEKESHEEGGSRRLWTLVIIGGLQTTALFASYSLLGDLLTSYIESTGNRWLFLPLFATYWLVWTLVGVCAAASSTKGVAFWSLATYILDTVIAFIWVWILGDDSVKLANF